MIFIMVIAIAFAIECGMHMDTAGTSTVQAKIEHLQAIRKRLGWSEEVCAYHVGVTYSTLNRWKRGESSPRSRLVLEAIDRFIAKYGHEGFDKGSPT